MAAEDDDEKVFVALPAEFKAGQSTLSWALSHLAGTGSTIVIAHVHVPSQMIPVMGGKFHASKVSPEQVTLFRWAERGKVNKMLNDYVHQCSKMKVKCEKIVFEKEDIVSGLIDLIASHGVTKLVIAAAADRHYSRKMDRPKSKTAREIMQRADPWCKIWFVCKGHLICTRDKGVEISRAVAVSVSPDGNGSSHSASGRRGRSMSSAGGEEKEKERAESRAETPVIPIKRRPETANSRTARRPSPPMPPTPPEPETDPEFVELDPTGRYGRYTEVLGKGAFKTVYKAFDQLEGLEVAWNQIKVGDLLRNNDDLERLKSEVRLLKTLKHKNIIKFYNSWLDRKNNNINFITEVFTSGTLRQYRIKHKKVDIRALKKWSRQILSGLHYLHSHDPPVIHRDLKCDNIFVNGNQGEVKIGDLGLATILDHACSAHSIIGTPEFMAPELYDEEYNELVDIYAFGMCVLELVTFEYPYCECSNAAQIYKKVSEGEKPGSLAKIDDPQVKFFIEKCIAKAPQRLSAKELLMDPFLLDVDDEKIFYPPHQSSNASETASGPNPSTSKYDRVGPSVDHHDHTGSMTDSHPSDHYVHESMDPHDAIGRIITVESQRKDLNTIFLKLRIADSTGHAQNIHFPFDIEADTSISVATEMVVQLDLTDQDVTAIAEMIDAEIRAHIPDWAMEESIENQDAEDAHSEGHSSDTDEETSQLRDEPATAHNGFVQEQLPSGRIYWSDSPRRENDVALQGENLQTSGNLSNGIVEKNDGEDIIHSTKHKENQSPTSHIHSMKGLSSSVGLSIPSTDDSISGGTSAASPHSSDGVRQYISADVTERLESLLSQQQEELNALQRKHDVDIQDILKSVPAEDREDTLIRCRLKVDKKKKLTNFS